MTLPDRKPDPLNPQVGDRFSINGFPERVYEVLEVRDSQVRVQLVPKPMWWERRLLSKDVHVPVESHAESTEVK